jgi:glutathione synthase/RimK-type ligase-like ATP-grasp enzyme
LTRLAVAASAAFPDLRPDWPILQAALARRGITAITQVWNDPDVSWHDLDLVVANGAWDNIHHPDQFLAWADEVSRHTMLVNSPATLRWNLDKRYLADLASADVPTVPTTWVEVGDVADRIDLPAGEFVVKPSISGGGFQTARYGTDASEHETARAHITQLIGVGRSVMVQPYQSAVDTEAETGLIFLGGRYSHAIRKGALLPMGTRAGASLYNDEAISPTRATQAQLATAVHTLEVAEALLAPTTYARVDLVPGHDGSPVLLELELLDPALFFEHYPPGADRFADVLAACLRSV